MKYLFIILALLMGCEAVNSPNGDIVPEESIEVTEEHQEEPVAELQVVILEEVEIEVFYHLSGVRKVYPVEWPPDYLSFGSAIMDGVELVKVVVEIDKYDLYLFMPGNTLDKFGFELSYITRVELEWMEEVVNRYPEETIWDLQEEWYEAENN